MSDVAYTAREELANSITHGIGAAFSVAGLILLTTISYVRGDAWPHLVVRYALDERSSRPSLMVRVPRGGWWPADGELSVPVLAADLLEHAEPRAVNAAARELNDRASALLRARANQRPVSR